MFWTVLLQIFLSFLCLYALTTWKSTSSIPSAHSNFPIIGNAISYRANPIQFLRRQQVRHGDVFLVNLGVIRIVYFLGPEGVNAILRGTETSGVSMFAAACHILGGAFEKWYSVKGCPELSHRIVKTLANSQLLGIWSDLVRPVANEQFRKWAEEGEPVPLFDGISNLALTAILYILTGPEFATRHAEEVVPLIKAYEPAAQKPQTKAFPRWASKAGRLLNSVEGRIKELIDDEINRRLKNPEKYKSRTDYLQIMLNITGDMYTEVCAYHILGLLNGGFTNQAPTFAWGLLHALRTPLLSTLRRTKSRDLLEASFREIGRLYSNLFILRRLTSPQVVLGKHLPKGTFIACSPLLAALDPKSFDEAEKFRPERWLTSQPQKIDDTKLKRVQRMGISTQFGKGQHACVGEGLTKILVLDMYWENILGNAEHPGYDVEIISGVVEGVGFDNVGVEAAWGKNLGTPFPKVDPVVRFTRRTNEAFNVRVSMLEELIIKREEPIHRMMEMNRTGYVS